MHIRFLRGRLRREKRCPKIQDEASGLDDHSVQWGMRRVREARFNKNGHGKGSGEYAEEALLGGQSCNTKQRKGQEAQGHNEGGVQERFKPEGGGHTNQAQPEIEAEEGRKGAAASRDGT